jgi:hypothetical protein
LEVRNWDDLLPRLRGREVNLFVAEISALEQEHDLEVAPMHEHPLFFAARSGHPLAKHRKVNAADTFSLPFVSLSRIPPRTLEPMLAAQRKEPDRSAAELEDQQLTLLGSEPWMFLRYGLVSLDDHRISAAAEYFRELVIDSEGALRVEEKDLVAQWNPDAADRR